MGIATLDISAPFLREVQTYLPSTVRIIGSQAAGAYGVVRLEIEGPQIQHGRAYTLLCETTELTLTARLIAK